MSTIHILYDFIKRKHEQDKGGDMRRTKKSIKIMMAMIWEDDDVNYKGGGGDDDHGIVQSVSW